MRVYTQYTAQNLLRITISTSRQLSTSRRIFKFLVEPYLAFIRAIILECPFIFLCTFLQNIRQNTRTVTVTPEICRNKKQGGWA